MTAINMCSNFGSFRLSSPKDYIKTKCPHISVFIILTILTRILIRLNTVCSAVWFMDFLLLGNCYK